VEELLVKLATGESSLTVPGILVILAFSLWKQWLVLGSHYRECMEGNKERDKKIEERDNRILEYQSRIEEEARANTVELRLLRDEVRRLLESKR
jgi:hypothetical protein